MDGGFLFGTTRGDMWVILVLVSVICAGAFIFMNSGYEQGKVKNPPNPKPYLAVVAFTFLAVMLAPQGNVQIVAAIKNKQIAAQAQELSLEVEELMAEIEDRKANDPTYDVIEASMDMNRMTELYMEAERIMESR